MRWTVASALVALLVLAALTETQGASWTDHLGSVADSLGVGELFGFGSGSSTGGTRSVPLGLSEARGKIDAAIAGPSQGGVCDKANADDVQAAIAAYTDAFVEAGAVLGPIEIACLPGYGLSLVATADLKAETTLVTVPGDLTMDPRRLRSPLPPAAFSDALTDRQRLALALANARAGRSSHPLDMTHASTLPGRLPLPLYLAETEAVAAFDRSFATDVASQREDLEDSFDALEAAVFAPDRAAWPAETFSLALVAWALSTVQAYAFNDAGVDVLVPIADKANHSPSARSHFEFGPDGTFTLTGGPARAGDQVFINYGGKGNAELLLGYGFAVRGNKDSYIRLKVGPQPSDPNGPRKAEVMRRSRVGGFLLFEDDIPPLLVATLRLIALSGDDATALISDTTTLDDFAEPVSPANEANAWRMFHSTLKTLLQKNQQHAVALRTVNDARLADFAVVVDDKMRILEKAIAKVKAERLALQQQQ